MTGRLSVFTEKKLLYRVRAHKDTDAFGILYDRYVAKIYRFVYLKVSHKEEAEDIVSDVFLKTWNYLTDSTRDHAVEVASFSGLIYTIARTSIIDFYRARANRRECTIEVLEGVADETDLTSDIATRQEIDSILMSLKKMKREYQEIIVLKYIEELSTAEIAEILDKNKTAVRVTLHRAMKILKKILSTSTTN